MKFFRRGGTRRRTRSPGRSRDRSSRFRSDALERDQLGGADDDTVGAETDRLDHVVHVAQPAAGDQGHFVGDPLFGQRLLGQTREQDA